MPSVLVESFEEHFGELDDPRRETKNQAHEFSDILLIALCAIICGANNWTAVSTLGRAKEQWLRTFLRLENGVPSHDTFTDVFAKLNAGVFERCFIEWVSSFAHLLPGEVVAIDGKTLRRSHDRPKGKQAIHIVSAWSSSNALVLGQFKTEEKSNEITAIPQLLEMLSLENSLVTIDAMGCQKAIAASILSKGADYLLAVKENQQSLYEAIDRLYWEAEDKAFAKRFGEYAQQEDKGHGREYLRRCWVCKGPRLLKPLVAVWPQLKAVVVVESHRTVNGETSIERRYYISSVDQVAEYFLKAARTHWHIENCLHWVLDVAFREDESRLRQGDGAENFSVFRRMALNLLKKEKSDKTGIENKRCRAGWDTQYLETVLSGLAA